MNVAQMVYSELRARLPDARMKAWVELPALHRLAWEQAVKLAWCEALSMVINVCTMKKTTGAP